MNAGNTSFDYSKVFRKENCNSYFENVAENDSFLFLNKSGFSLFTKEGAVDTFIRIDIN